MPVRPVAAPRAAALFTAAALLAAVPAPAEAALPPPRFETTAPIALMVDLGSGRLLFAKDANRRFIPASLTKVMTTYVAFELIERGQLQLNQTFPVRDATFEEWYGKGSNMFIARGSQVRVDDLLRGIVTVSANDASVVLAEGISGSVPRFAALMNAEARKLGMRNSRFGTPNGWPDEGGTYVSAQDLATLTRALIVRHPALYKHFFGHSTMVWNGIEQRNRNPLYGAVPGADGVKTGHTNESGYGFIGSAVRNGRRLVMVVAGYDSPRDRRDQSRAFIEWGFSAWEARRLFEPRQSIGWARVQGGDERWVALASTTPVFATVPRGAPADAQLTVRYKGPLRAPISRGEEVGALVISTPGQVPAEVPLVALSDVPAAGVLARLRDGLLGLIGQ